MTVVGLVISSDVIVHLVCWSGQVTRECILYGFPWQSEMLAIEYSLAGCPLTAIVRMQNNLGLLSNHQCVSLKCFVTCIVQVICMLGNLFVAISWMARSLYSVHYMLVEGPFDSCLFEAIIEVACQLVCFSGCVNVLGAAYVSSAVHAW